MLPVGRGLGVAAPVVVVPVLGVPAAVPVPTALLPVVIALAEPAFALPVAVLPGKGSRC